MIRRMVTRLVVAKLMQVGMKAGQKAFRNRMSGKGQANRSDKPSNNTAIENGNMTDAAMRDVTDKGNS